MWPWNWFIPQGRVMQCYRLDYRADYDEDAVWQLVKQYGGRIEVRRDCVDFWIDAAFEPVITLAFPDLTRKPTLDSV